MSSFAERIIAAHQQGLAERKAEEDQAFQKQIRDFQLKDLKHQQDRLKLQDQAADLDFALKQRSVQAMLPGGPSGQATTETPYWQPPDQPPTSAPRSLNELLLRRN